LSCASIAFSDR